MIRTSLTLTEQQVKAIRALAASTGLKFSEIMRRAIDLYLETLAQKREK